MITLTSIFVCSVSKWDWQYLKLQLLAGSFIRYPDLTTNNIFPMYF